LPRWEEELKEATTVRLITSEWPIMIVEEIQNSKDIISVVWMDKEGHVQRDSFHKDALVPVLKPIPTGYVYMQPITSYTSNDLQRAQAEMAQAAAQEWTTQTSFYTVTPEGEIKVDYTKK
jgi:uncharacterized protein YodC (DUF2158 family)